MARTNTNTGGGGGGVIISINGDATPAQLITAGAGISVVTVGGNTTITNTTGPGNDWALLGNAGTIFGTNFVGTTDNVNLMFKVNNTEAGYLVVNGSTAFGYRSGLSDVSNHGVFVGANAGVNNAAGDNNTFIGFAAGQQNIVGNDNTFVGRNAGFANTGSSNSFFGSLSGGVNITGNGNSFYGTQSGQNNSSGGNNTFIGNQSGFANASGNRNVAIGNGALNSLVSNNGNVAIGDTAFANNLAADNVAVGQAAGFANTTGIRNTFIGRAAGNGNVFGTDNTFLGFDAGFASTASNNTFLGSQSGINTTTGPSNTFVGNNTGFTNTTGGFNVYVGKNTGQSNNGDQNVFMGYNAGVGSTNSTNNTLIGYNAGNSVSTGGQNTFIGVNAGPATTTGSENIAIGNSASAQNIIGASTIAIGSNALNNNVRDEIIGIGNGAGASNANGLQNTYVGTHANTITGAGIDQTALGYASSVDNRGTALGSNAVSGSQGTAVGAHSTAAVDGIALGYISSAASNEFALPDSITNWKFQGDSYTLPTAFGAAGTALVDTTGAGNLVWTAVGTGNVTGSGTTPRIPYWSSASNLTDDANFTRLVNRGVHLEDNTATHNTFFGADAGAASIAGLSNVALGYRVGNALTSGDNNVFLGAGAGNLVSTADGNIAIGQSAASTLTTGSNNTIIGNLAAVGAVNTTGAIALGNGASAVTNQFALPDAITTWKFQGDSYTLPTTFGATGDVLTDTNGAGLLSWVTPTGTIGGTITTNQIGFGSGVNTLTSGADMTWIPGTKIFSVGDLISTGNDNKFVLNDNTGVTTLTSSLAYAIQDPAGNVWQQVIPAFHQVNQGDISGNFNLTTFQVDDLTRSVSASVVVAGVGSTFRFNATRAEMLYSNGGTNWGFSAESSGGGETKITANNQIWIWPQADSVGTQALVSDGAGNLTWASLGGGLSLAAIGAAPNANGATLTGTVLNLEPASATFGGVVTTGAQVFAGAKTFNGNIIAAARVEMDMGANVASANDVTLGADGNFFTITGATQFNTIITTGWQAGSMITLLFTGTPTVKHNTAGAGAVLFLAGSVDLSAANNTILGLIYDGTQWQETFRKVA